MMCGKRWQPLKEDEDPNTVRHRPPDKTGRQVKARAVVQKTKKGKTKWKTEEYLNLWQSRYFLFVRFNPMGRFWHCFGISEI
jgi:hypothetical protein